VGVALDYDTYYSAPTTRKIYLYDWDGSEWDYVDSFTDRHTIATTTLAIKMDADVANELNNDVDFNLMIGTYSGTDTSLYSGELHHNYNTPTAAGNHFHDWLDTTGSSSDPFGKDPDPQTIPEFSDFIIPVFAIFALFVVVRWRRRK